MPKSMTTKKETIPNKMTVERLREHLFGGPQVPFWNYDPQKITIGMEIEYFIAHVSGESFTLATKIEYLEVIEHLKKDANYRDHGLPDQPGRVSRDTEYGFVAIKPDFAWHILEISLPPRKKISDLRSLLETVFSEVDRALTKVGLERLDISCLPEAPKKMDLVELDRLRLFSNSVNQPVKENPLIDPLFPAYIVATHVHINACNENSLSILPKLFELDEVISLKFVRAKYFAGLELKDVRTQMYADTLGHEYLLHTIPEVLPGDLNALVSLMNASKPLFPNDTFFPVRNMTYIRPTRYGTFEFRSACSHRDINILLNIASWRCAQVIAVCAESIVSKNIEEPIKDAINELQRHIKCRI